ncbi:MAG TPA: response regulator [Gammaproteobacteria bacterium]|nr:response regulator [Gammaproteobacteria bacterium]
MGNGKVILLVEDESDLRQAMAWLLEYHGYSVETAANGKEALARLEQIERPCLIILDLMMPEMNGWELRKGLLRHPELADVPVVLVSGAIDIDKAARSLKAVDYLTKPVDFSRLFGVIEAYC